MKVTRKSLLTGIEHTLEIDVTEEQLAAWRAGATVQDAMPHLDAPMREFIMTGITPEEWEKHMKEDDDAYPDDDNY